MILDLVRHADTGRRGHLDGRSDPPLLEGAVEAACRRHAGIHWRRIVSSPLRRAHDTALALAAPRDLPVQIDGRWAELDFGDWDGLRGDTLAPGLLAAFHADPVRHPPPGGEPWDAFGGRVLDALSALRVDAAGDAGPVLVVSHGGPLRMALSQACGLPLPALWSLRIDYGTRLRLRLEVGDDGRPWGELLELVQP